MDRFGEFKQLCLHAPSYAWCNLFYLQLQREAEGTLGPASARPSAPVGVNPECGIYLIHTLNSRSNIANNIACAVGFIGCIWLVISCHKRMAAVGRTEFRAFLITYLLSFVFQVLAIGALLQQGTTALGVLTSIHAGIVACLFWLLLWTAFVAMQLVDDGRKTSIIIMHTVQCAFFIATLYIGLDIAFGLTTAVGSVSSTPDALRSVPLFVLTTLWPAVAVVVSFLIFVHITIRVLHERRPFWIFTAAVLLFVVSQVFRLSPVGKMMCEDSSRTVDGSFVATALETVSVFLFYWGWINITRASWDDERLEKP